MLKINPAVSNALPHITASAPSPETVVHLELKAHCGCGWKLSSPDAVRAAVAHFNDTKHTTFIRGEVR